MYIGIGNWVTLAPPSSAVILLTPCFLTSSMRRIALDTLLRRVEHDRGALAEDELFHLDEAKQLPVVYLAGVNLVYLALIHEHNAENVTGCHGSAGIHC